MIIRPAALDDADDIAQVNVEGWRTAYKDLLSAEYLAGLSVETRRDRWRDSLTQAETNKTTFVAETDGEVIGFVSCGPERTADARFAGEIYAIYLRKDHCRQGIGTILFRRGVEFLLSHRLNSMKVWVLKDNPYRTFYERQNGQVVDEKSITIGDAELMETAYGWESLDSFRRSPMIRRVCSEDQAEWLRMRRALWPEASPDDLTEDMQVWLREEQCVALVAERADTGLCGFLEAAIRPCNVQGAFGRFGYVEGWYVDPDVRREGIGKLLVEAAETWVRDQGCDEILSDARLENSLSHTAHQALGFSEVERLVHYRKSLP